VRCALYARVSTLDQQSENQLAELRAYIATRQWTLVGEFQDEGVSGAKDRRPALDRLMADAPRSSGLHMRLVPRPIREIARPCGDGRAGTA
jgi:DNA invertase Pin-like site-specific DNA recombinase